VFYAILVHHKIHNCGVSINDGFQMSLFSYEGMNGIETLGFCFRYFYQFNWCWYQKYYVQYFEIL